jgi:hypothetical protein
MQGNISLHFIHERSRSTAVESLPIHRHDLFVVRPSPELLLGGGPTTRVELRCSPPQA